MKRGEEWEGKHGSKTSTWSRERGRVLRTWGSGRVRTKWVGMGGRRPGVDGRYLAPGTGLVPVRVQSGPKKIRVKGGFAGFQSGERSGMQMKGVASLADEATCLAGSLAIVCSLLTVGVELEAQPDASSTPSVMLRSDLWVAAMMRMSSGTCSSPVAFHMHQSQNLDQIITTVSHPASRAHVTDLKCA